jgi:Protein of unknown function (DUF2793)
MTDVTARFALPLLMQGQAQKEVTHNEALSLTDLLMAPVIQSVAPPTIPASPQAGQGWIVGAAPAGAWSGQAGKLAFWTAGGWRFVAAPEGVTVWSIADSLPVQRTASGWATGALRAASLSVSGVQVVGARLAAVPNPAGGSVIDVEARAALTAILSRLRDHGLIAT